MKKEDLRSYFKDICGYEREKQELMYLADIMRDPGPYRALGTRVPRNVVLVGEPGVGKTLMAECLIRASGRTAYRLRKDEDDEEFVKKLCDTFDEARRTAPSAILLDDMDKYVAGLYGSSTEETTIQTYIDEMRDEEVFIIATINQTRGMSKSLLRAGRFDRILYIGLPDSRSAEMIIRRYFAGTKTISPEIDISDVVDITAGMTAVEIRTLANEAGVYAGFERSGYITMDHIIRAYVERMGNDRRDNHIDDEERTRNTACHEAGHAVMAELLCEGSVGLAFIGRSAGTSEGFIARNRRESRIEVNQHRIDILTSLAGRAATELVYGRPDRGSGHDISVAIERIYSEITGLCADGLHLATGEKCLREPMSDSRKDLIDRMVRDRLKEYYAEALDILRSNRAFLDSVAMELEEKGWLLGRDIRRIREGLGYRPMEPSYGTVKDKMEDKTA